MTADVAALETRLLLPLRRAAEDAVTRLGMTLDPARELPEAEPPGGDAAEAAAAAGPQSPRHMAGGADHAGAGARLNVSSAPRVTQDVRPQALRLAPARREDVPAPRRREDVPAPVRREDVPAPVRREDVNAPIQLPEPAYLGEDGAGEFVPAGSVQIVAEAAGVRLSSPDGFWGESRGASAAPEAGWRMAGQTRFAEAPIASAVQPPGTPPVAPAPETRLTPSASSPLARGLAAPPPSPAQAGAGSSGEVLSQSQFQPSSGFPLRPAQGDPAAGELMAAPAAGELMAAADLLPASGAMGRPALPEEAFGAPAARALADMPGRATAAQATAAPALPPEEKFGGLMPVRSVAGTPDRADHAAALAGAPPYPAAASVTSAYAAADPMLGEVARAMQPVLSRAADLGEAVLGEAAWDDGETPKAAAAAVSNTFNVTVAMAGNSGAVEREALQDALTDLLRDAARRQGLDL